VLLVLEVAWLASAQALVFVHQLDADCCGVVAPALLVVHASLMKCPGCKASVTRFSGRGRDFKSRLEITLLLFDMSVIF
jgi:hypothetical protein